MSTEIKDTGVAGDFTRLMLDGDEVELTVRDSSQFPAVVAEGVVTIPEFLAAVETECHVRLVPADSPAIKWVPADAIVIDRAELPTFPPGATHVVGVDPMTAEKARAVALAHLALAEYLDAHPPTPPVDEADVEAVREQVAAEIEAAPPPSVATFGSEVYVAGIRDGLHTAARIARGESS